MKMIFLVDGDNNIGTGLQGIDLLTAEDTVLVFFGKGQTLANVKKLCAGTKAQVQYLESVKGGKNSLDFQIITELGVLVGRGEADFAYVISQDKGYEAAMSALHARYASTFREVALRPSIQDCLQAAFLLRAGTREELAAALARQYGPVQGQLAYEHLEALLTPPPVQEAAAPSPAPENKAASKPGKRRSRAAAKPAETAEPGPRAPHRMRRSLPGRRSLPPRPPDPAAAVPAAAGSGRSGPRQKKHDKRPPQWATRRPASLAGRRLSRCLLFVQGPQQGLHGPLHHPDRLFVPVPQQIHDPLHSVPGRAEEHIVGVQIQQAAQADKVLQPGAGVSQLQIRNKGHR